jgi:hypothetical protein
MRSLDSSVLRKWMNLLNAPTTERSTTAEVPLLLLT